MASNCAKRIIVTNWRDVEECDARWSETDVGNYFWPTLPGRAKACEMHRELLVAPAGLKVWSPVEQEVAVSSKSRGGSLKGFSEEDLQEILATLPNSPKLAACQDIRQWLQEWHSEYAGLSKKKEVESTENTRAVEVQVALREVEVALLKAHMKILELQAEGVIDVRRISEMARIINERFNQGISAFSPAVSEYSQSIHHLLILVKDLVPLFEPSNDYSLKGRPNKMVEREGIRALARIYSRATKRRPTVTKVINSGDRAGPYFEFATAVILRVWSGQKPTSLIEEIGREIGTELDTFLSQ